MVADLGRRSPLPERMDDPAAAGPDLERALGAIAWVNRFLGGRRAALAGLERLARGRTHLRVLDVGCGAADIPLAMAAWGRRRGLHVQVTALDFNPQVCAHARRRAQGHSEVCVLRADAFRPPFAPGAFDVAHCGMFLHHFGRESIVALLRGLGALCPGGVILNDLQRHRLAWAGIWVLTRLLSRSAMLRHDAPVSVLRGFRCAELEEMARAAGLRQVRVGRCWAFRLLATGRAAG